MELATSHNNVGTLLRDTGRSAEAERSFRRAVELYQTLVERSPEAHEPRSVELRRLRDEAAGVLGWSVAAEGVVNSPPKPASGPQGSPGVAVGIR